MGALDIVAKAAKGAKKAAPFYSKADLVLDELQRGKGSGNEFLGEMIKKGVKPTELRERGIEQVLKDIPKMTKAEVQKIFEEKAAPKVREQVRGGGDYEEALDLKAQEFLGERDASFYELNYRDKELAKEEVKRDFGYDPETKYEEYSTPGGENYREILLKLPRRGLREGEQARLMAYEADMRRGKELESFQKREYDELKKKESQSNQDFRSRHFSDTPNILAHIRVQDYITPTYTKQQAEAIGQRIADGMGVANPMNLGNGSIGVAIKNGYVTPKEAAQYADFRKFQNVDTTGAKRKVLLVDEIQSDWHQAGRDLRNKEIKRIMNETGVDKKTASAQVPDDFGYGPSKKLELANQEHLAAKESLSKAILDLDPAADVDKTIVDLRRHFNGDLQIMGMTPELDNVFKPLVAREASRLEVLRREKSDPNVPDAPFKKNWHELAMKRVLDYATENGYDTVAITPGIQQVKRYEDATRQAVDEVAMYGDTLVGFKGGRRVIEQPISSPDELEKYVGKDIAQKLSTAAPDMNFIQSVKGEDLTVGGEGMKGFYDKILPDYLNNYGKKYGAQVGEIRLPVAPSDSTAVQGYNLGDDYMQGRAVWSEFLQANPGAEANFSPAYHAIDITPQMREEIKTKGQPMYGKVAMPALEGLAAGSGAATIGPQVFDMDNEQDVQNPIHFSENPDAMRLELMQSNQIE